MDLAACMRVLAGVMSAGQASEQYALCSAMRYLAINVIDFENQLKA